MAIFDRYDIITRHWQFTTTSDAFRTAKAGSDVPCGDGAPVRGNDEGTVGVAADRRNRPRFTTSAARLFPEPVRGTISVRSAGERVRSQSEVCRGRTLRMSPVPGAVGTARQPPRRFPSVTS